jgi:predicted N-formylglutamate amidohydrolase
MINNKQSQRKLLSSQEPDPVGIHNHIMDSPWLFLCEHACNMIPLSLNMLGLSQREINRHIGWDIGILDVAKGITDRLNAPLFFQHYSRLVIDCNRPLASPDLIPVKSENTVIIGNRELSSGEREKRINEIWKPYQEEIRKHLETRIVQKTMLVAMHSFTPVFQGKSRPWHIGLLYNRVPTMAQALKEILCKYDNSLNIGMNNPYTVSDDDDYTIPVFGEEMGLPHVLVEIRQDLINTKENLARWINLFTLAFQELQNIFYGKDTDGWKFYHARFLLH